MTRNEFKIIIAILSSNYSRFGLETKEQFDFWFSMFADTEYGTMQIAIRKLLFENKFAPTIAEIRQALVDVTVHKSINNADAWEEVQRAIKKFGSYREKEALTSLSATTKRVVKAMGFKTLCLSEDQMADRAHFLKMHSQVSEREQKDALIPADLKKQINELTNNNMLRLVE